MFPIFPPAINLFSQMQSSEDVCLITITFYYAELESRKLSKPSWFFSWNCTWRLPRLSKQELCGFCVFLSFFSGRGVLEGGTWKDHATVKMLIFYESSATEKLLFSYIYHECQQPDFGKYLVAPLTPALWPDNGGISSDKRAAVIGNCLGFSWIVRLVLCFKSYDIRLE